MAKNVDMKNVDLEISYHTDKDKINAKAFMGSLKTAPKKVSFIRLDEIKRYEQLTLF